MSYPAYPGQIVFSSEPYVSPESYERSEPQTVTRQPLLTEAEAYPLITAAIRGGPEFAQEISLYWNGDFSTAYVSAGQDDFSMIMYFDPTLSKTNHGETFVIAHWRAIGFDPVTASDGYVLSVVRRLLHGVLLERFLDANRDEIVGGSEEEGRILRVGFRHEDYNYDNEVIYRTSWNGPVRVRTFDIGGQVVLPGVLIERYPDEIEELEANEVTVITEPKPRALFSRIPGSYRDLGRPL